MTADNNKKIDSEGYELKPVVPLTNDWQEFHEIIRTALFDQAPDEYDVESVDTYRPQHATRIPLLLKFRDKVVGTIAIDDLGTGRAAIRLVAISKEHQGKGHGSALLALTAKTAKAHGITELCVNADSAKTAFYRSAGFTEHEWGPEELEDCRAGRSWPTPAQMCLTLT